MREKLKVLIIGAGIAGLAAAQKLLSNDYNVTLLEARNRIGGRTWTKYELGVPLDIGAFLIHGSDGNPIVELANLFHANIKLLDLHAVSFVKSKQPIAKEQLIAIDDQYNSLLERASAYARRAKQDMSLAAAIKQVFHSNEFPLLTKDFFAWKSLLLTFYTGADPKYLSARYWNKDEIILEGGNFFMLDGYKPLIMGLAKNIPIILNSKVKHIKMTRHGVKVKTEKDIYEADVVIITVPLGVFKNEIITFEPELPDIKQHCISQLKMGLLNKIALKFPHVFWAEDTRAVTYLTKKYSTFAWFINYFYYLKQPILLGILSGDMAHDIEKLTDKMTCELAMDVLRELFGNKIPDPTDFFITRWGQDPYAFGSYSYIPVGASGKDFDALSQPIENKLYFAGEATECNFVATTHGAYLSGIREADRVMQNFE